MDLAQIAIDTPYYKRLVMAMVTDHPIHDLLLGNIPGVRSPDKPASNWNPCNVMTRTQAKKQTQTTKPLKITNPDSLLVDRHQLIELQKADGDISKLYDAAEYIKKFSRLKGLRQLPYIYVWKV